MLTRRRGTPSSSLPRAKSRTSLTSAGREIAFEQPIGEPRTGERNVRIRRALTGKQRNARTGIVEIDFAGNPRTQPDAVRIRAASGERRAASGRSQLRRTKLELDGRDLTVAGTISRRVDGVIRLRVSYARSGEIDTWHGRAQIKAVAGRSRSSFRRPRPPTPTPT
jgi:hypothetical protein